MKCGVCIQYMLCPTFHCFYLINQKSYKNIIWAQNNMYKCEYFTCEILLDIRAMLRLCPFQ